MCFLLVSRMHMKQTIYLCVIALVILSCCGMLNVSAEDMTKTTHSITITSLDDKFSVSESISVQSDDLELLDFFDVYISSTATDIRITIQNHLVSNEKLAETYRCNLSSIDLANKSSMNVEISYTLPLASIEFSTMTLRNITKLMVQFNGENLVSLNSITSGLLVSLPLLVDQDETSLFNIYIIILIVLLVVVIAVSILFFVKRKQPVQTRSRSMESEEILQTEYALLKEMLKQIEKNYRAQKIADETYHKLKSYYKQQAVETMSVLESIGSKIKE